MSQIVHGKVAFLQDVCECVSSGTQRVIFGGDESPPHGIEGSHPAGFHVTFEEQPASGGNAYGPDYIIAMHNVQGDWIIQTVDVKARGFDRECKKEIYKCDLQFVEAIRIVDKKNQIGRTAPHGMMMGLAAKDALAEAKAKKLPVLVANTPGGIDHQRLLVDCGRCGICKLVITVAVSVRQWQVLVTPSGFPALASMVPKEPLSYVLIKKKSAGNCDCENVEVDTGLGAYFTGSERTSFKYWYTWSWEICPCDPGDLPPPPSRTPTVKPPPDLTPPVPPPAPVQPPVTPGGGADGQEPGGEKKGPDGDGAKEEGDSKEGQSWAVGGKGGMVAHGETLVLARTGVDR